MSLVLLIGASSSGKSSFAKKHFLPSEVVSSDACRAMVSNDENSLAASTDAFELARFIVGKRLKNGLTTVIDATNVQEEARKEWVQLARQYHVLPVAIAFNLSEKICTERHAARTDRSFAGHVIPRQIVQLKRSLRRLKLEGFRQVHEFKRPEDVEQVTAIVRDPLYNNRKHETGPFDIIGDIHGCYTELVLLLQKLGYAPNAEGRWQHPEGRKPVFLGDLVDRGPDSPAVLRLVMDLVQSGLALCVPGNHDVKLLRWLNGKQVQINHGLQQTVAQLAEQPAAFHEEVKRFIDGLISHYVLDDGNLVVAHAGLKEEMHGRGSGKVREFCYYGETTGEIDEFGLPVRYNWASEYKGKAMVVYGHTPVPAPQWLNRTIDIDTGCVFGGSLTALRYPEKELVQVPALQVYCEPVRPLLPPEPQLNLQQQHDDVLDIADYSGKLHIETRFGHNVTIREENAIAAIELMSRFAINPKWLIYLPPTMSPAETSKLPDYLEYPSEAFDYFRGVGVTKVVCEEKHMGSRAVVIVAKGEKTVESTFGIRNEGIGVIYTRTGRSYFTDKPTEQALLHRLNEALHTSGFYEKFDTDWACFDCELMPWNAKARTLLETQYGATGAAASHALAAATAALQQNSETARLLEKYTLRQQQAHQFIDAYRQYCWPVNALEDYKLAPFHILATAGKNWLSQHHEWHMEHIAAVAAADPGILLATTAKTVHLNDPADVQEAIDWWTALTEKGGEGMVVKPFDFIHQHNRGIAQPAIKIRGREYLRIIYGPEYTTPEHLQRLKARGLSLKRSLALREFALGAEGLERFTANEPLRRVHECVFGVLALESEPVDPRL